MTPETIELGILVAVKSQPDFPMTVGSLSPDKTLAVCYYTLFANETRVVSVEIPTCALQSYPAPS